MMRELIFCQKLCESKLRSWELLREKTGLFRIEPSIIQMSERFCAAPPPKNYSEANLRHVKLTLSTKNKLGF